MADQRLAHILEVRKILTPEQFKKFSEKMKDRKNHGGHWSKKDRKDSEVLASFVNHVCKLHGHVSNFLRSYSYSL